MANLIKTASDEVREIILKALAELVADGELANEAIPAFNVEIPADAKNGDMSTNVAMVCARTFRMAPRMIADKILTKVYLEGSFFEKCEVAGAGFINFFFSDKWFGEVVKNVSDEVC